MRRFLLTDLERDAGDFIAQRQFLEACRIAVAKEEEQRITVSNARMDVHIRAREERMGCHHLAPGRCDQAERELVIAQEHIAR